MTRLLLSAVVLLGCSSAQFDVASGSPDTGTAPADTGVAVEDTGAAEDTLPGEAEPLPDTLLPPQVDAPCPGAIDSTTDVYVNAAAPPGGKGTAGCPFRTLRDAINVPLVPGVKRVVHVTAGTYNEASPVRVRSLETFRGEGGEAKLVSASEDKCPPVDGSCAVVVDPAGVLEKFWVEAPPSTFGIVMVGASGTPPEVRNTTVSEALKDGIMVFGTAANLGPGVRSNANGADGVAMRGTGKLRITGIGNGFENNKNGAGIHVLSGQLFLDGGTTLTNNMHGVFFDTSGASTAEQYVSQVTAQFNKNGLVIGKGWSKVIVRKSVFTKNSLVGVYAEYDSSSANVFDFGTSAAHGGNTFAGSAGKNTRAGIFLCQSGGAGSLQAEGNKWSGCPPTQTLHTSCESTPAAYSDVVYVPRFMGPPLEPVYAPSSSCSVGP